MSYMYRNFTQNKSISADNTDAFLETVVEGIAQKITEAVRVEGELALLINSKFKMTFARSRNETIHITTQAEGNSWQTSKEIQLATGTSYSLKVKIAANSKTFDMKIRNCFTSETSLNFTADILCLIDGSNRGYYGAGSQSALYYYASGDRVFATDSNLYICSENIRSAVLKKRLDYVYESLTFETISGKALTEGGIYKGTCERLKDSSTMQGDMVYPVDGKRYYTVDDNTMIEV